MPKCGPLTNQLTGICAKGQWAPIAAASLAVIGSLYLLLAKDIDGIEKEKYMNACACPHCPAYSQGLAAHRQAGRGSETASLRGSEFYRTRSSQSLRRSSPSSNEHREGLTRIASDAMTLASHLSASMITNTEIYHSPIISHKGLFQAC